MSLHLGNAPRVAKRSRRPASLAALALLGACGDSEPRAADRGTPESLALRVAELEQELQAERSAYRIEQQDWQAERERLEDLLASERTARFEREQEWLLYLQGVGALKPDALPSDRSFDVLLPFALEGAAASGPA